MDNVVIVVDDSTEEVTVVVNQDGDINTINSIVEGEPTGSDVVLNVVSLTQSEYDAGVIIPTTLYIIK